MTKPAQVMQIEQLNDKAPSNNEKSQTNPNRQTDPMTKPAQKIRGHKKKNRKKRGIQFLDFQFQSKGKSNELGSRKNLEKKG